MEKITISIQGVHTRFRDCPSPHLRYNGWNSRPGAEHSRNNTAAPSPYSTLRTRAPRSVTSKGKMNKESSLQSKQQVNVVSQLELLQTLPSPSSALPSHVRQGSTGRVSQTSSPPARMEPHPFPAVLQAPVSLKVAKGKSVAVKARGSLNLGTAHRM